MLVKKMAVLGFLLRIMGEDTDGKWNIAGQTGYAGEIVVDQETNSSLFYWMFQAVNGNIESDTRPIVIWLPGGPGCSSAVNMFGEQFSSLYVDSEGVPHFNNLTWNLRVHLLAIDFPYGVGYSYPTGWNDWITSTEAGVKLFINFINILKTRHPFWLNRNIFIGGQEFSGIFIPAIASQILVNNQNLTPSNSSYFNLIGVILGDSWINGAYQSLYYHTFSFNEGLVNKEQMKQVSILENYIVGNASISPQSAFLSFQNLISYVESVSGSVDCLNYRSYSPESFDNLDIFLNNPDYKQKFNVPGNVVWTLCSSAVYGNLSSSLFVSQASYLKTILSKLKVLIFSSQDDFLINSMGTQTLIRSLGWSGLNDFLSARRGVWTVAGKIVGYAQSSTNLTYVQILNSGIDVGYEQTLNTRDMIFRFIFNQGWN